MTSACPKPEMAGKCPNGRYWRTVTATSKRRLKTSFLQEDGARKRNSERDVTADDTSVAVHDEEKMVTMEISSDSS